MQKLLKIIGMISALIISVLGLSACNRDAENISLYGVPPSYEDLNEFQTNGEKENLDSVNTTRGEEADADASALE